MPIFLAVLALLQSPWDIAKGATGKATTQKLRNLVNALIRAKKELDSARGVPEKEIVAVGKGSEEPLVKPDDTPAKKAKNRRYEIRVRL